MSFPTAYLSRPAVLLPGRRLTNDDVLAAIRDNYRGQPADWPEIERGARFVLQRCNSQVRYLEADPTVRVGDCGAAVARACLEQCGRLPADVDILISGSIAREYFEPATAMEIAAKVGLERVHAFDVTSACVGQLEAVHIACGHFCLDPQVDTALLVAAELTRQFLAYDIQSPAELVLKAAGLTIGNAATAWLLGRAPFAGGCLELHGMSHLSLPQHWELCQAPIDGTFASDSHELFKLHVHVAPELARVLDTLGWSVDEVDHFVFHQPSEHMIRKVLGQLGAPPDKAILTHHLYGNTASTTVALTMHELLRQRQVEPGDKLVLSSAAAGFSMVTAAGVWVA